jgi:hypothetical protein
VIGLQVCQLVAPSANTAANVLITLGTICSLAFSTIGQCPDSFALSSMPSYNLTYTVYQKAYATPDGFWFFNSRDAVLANNPDLAGTVSQLTAWNARTNANAVTQSAGQAAIQAFFQQSTSTLSVAFTYIRYSNGAATPIFENYQTTAPTATTACATCNTAVMNAQAFPAAPNGFATFGGTIGDANTLCLGAAGTGPCTVQVTGCAAGPAVSGVLTAYACTSSATQSFGVAAATAAAPSVPPQANTITVTGASQTVGTVAPGASLIFQATTLAQADVAGRKGFLMAMIQPSLASNIVPSSSVPERVMTSGTVLTPTATAAQPAAGLTVVVPAASVWGNSQVIGQFFQCQQGIAGVTAGVATTPATPAACRSGSSSATAADAIFPGTMESVATVGVVSTNGFKIQITPAAGRRLKML